MFDFKAGSLKLCILVSKVYLPQQPASIARHNGSSVMATSPVSVSCGRVTAWHLCHTGPLPTWSSPAISVTSVTLGPDIASQHRHTAPNAIISQSRDMLESRSMFILILICQMSPITHGLLYSSLHSNNFGISSSLELWNKYSVLLSTQLQCWRLLRRIQSIQSIRVTPEFPCKVTISSTVPARAVKKTSRSYSFRRRPQIWNWATCLQRS